MTGKPTVTPARWGRVRFIPNREPEAASITLLGPGVNAIAVAKIRTAVKVCRGMGAEDKAKFPACDPPSMHDGYLGIPAGRHGVDAVFPGCQRRLLSVGGLV